jgi:aminopeptidase-like protein
LTITELKSGLDREAAGREMYGLMAELYPICRSITGDGFRATLARLQLHVPLIPHEVPSGTPVFDWTVPREWNIRDAYIKNARGERVVDFKRHNLHVLNYSIPVSRRVSLKELKEHLFTLPEHPDWIPYHTSYYREQWGFCVTARQLADLTEPEYEVCIDASLQPGHLTYGELLLPGETPDEILISCHACHPSLCNDNLSGVVVATWLAKHLARIACRYSYRFLFIPGTIGSITWLSGNEDKVAAIRHGLVLACVGDPGKFHYKRSRQGLAEIDRAAVHVLQHSGQEYAVEDFDPYGNDERQYCSPAFNLAVGCLSRTPHGQFPEYHTSADNLDLVRPEALGDSLAQCLSILNVVENNRVYMNLNPKCEPQLGKRGLYQSIGGEKDAGAAEKAMLWVLNFSDGEHSLLDIASKSGMSFDALHGAVLLLLEHDLLEECTPRAVVAAEGK